ncbi:MAG TPA: DUF2127 domain-containing protein [Candidatus Acidoferrales bacterium]|nr:DUF2127 domain-containing protein [Candidatus Acidoferrales bacterium]
MSDEQKNVGVPAPAPKPKRAPTLYLIVADKFLKGITALLLALGAFSLEDNNLPEDFRKLLEFLHIDPEKKFFLEIADRLSEITANNLKWVAVLSIVYGLFNLLQAVGLAFRVSWAVWLVILESAFFIPIEVFELVRRHVPNPDHPHHLAHPKVGIAIVLLVNVVIVWYLFKNRDRLIRRHHHHHRSQ